MLKLLQRIVELNLPNLNLEALKTKIHTLKIMNLDINDCIKGDQNLFVKFNKERIKFEVTTSDGHISPAAVISTFIDDLEDLLALFIEIESTLYSYVQD